MSKEKCLMLDSLTFRSINYYFIVLLLYFNIISLYQLLLVFWQYGHILH